MPSIARPTALVALLIVSSARGDSDDRSRAPVPPAEAREAALKLIRSVFAEELAWTEPDRVRGFLDTLIQQGTETDSDPAARFMLFELATEGAVRLGDLPRATRAFERLAREFEIEALDARATMLRDIAPRLPDAAGAHALGSAVADLLPDLVRDERFEAAAAMVEAAEAAAQRTKDVPTAARLAQARRELAEARDADAAADEALRRLAEAPDDPHAHGAVGHYLAFNKGDWPAALPHLAGGDDEALRALAGRELAASPDDSYALAGAWWDWAETQEAPRPRSAGRAHAASLYERALPNLKGLHRTVAERRMRASATEPATTGTPRWLVIFRGDDPAAWNTAGRGNTVAVPLDRVPADIKFLRLRRLDTGESLVVPVTAAALGKGNHESPGYFKWNGDNVEAWGSRHLGIVEGRVISGFDRDYGPMLIAVQSLGIDYLIGSGFGHKAHGPEGIQYFGWRGQEIPRTAFEIAVTADPVQPTPAPAPESAEGEPRLAAEHDLGQGFAIRPPIGYQYRRQNFGPLALHRWTGPRRPDGSEPTLQVIFLPTDPESGPNPNSAGLLDRALEPLRRANSEYRRLGGGLGTRLQVAGRVYDRHMLQLKQRQGSTEIVNAGSMFVGQDGNLTIGVVFLDAEPHSAQTLRTLEAAARTFRRR